MNEFQEIIKTLDTLATEQVNSKSLDIDKKSASEILQIINNEDKTVADVVKSQIDVIAKTAEQFAKTIRNNGRIFYIGAGTSGRLGVLDAAECPPTFGSERDQIIGVIAGGYETLVLSKEGVEDNTKAAIDDLQKHKLHNNDMVIGIAASRRTPYTLSGLSYAHSIKCTTAFVICNKWDLNDNRSFVDFLIELPVGPEVITGSTRMKSGTAQKLVLNMISTTAMVLLGKTYGNRMVDLQATSKKLSARSRKTLIDLLDITFEEADKLLLSANGSVKIALVMKKFNCTIEKSKTMIDKANGFISKIKEGDM